MSDENHKPGSKYYWGPRLWRMMHTLADISNRRDIVQIWSIFLNASAAVLPCAACRQHFQAYLKTHIMIPVKNPLQITGALMRQQIRKSIHNFHNDVNKRLGKPHYKLETTKPPPRPEALQTIQTLLSEILAAWEPQLHTSIPPQAYTQWKSTLQMLIAMLAGGPN
jgi:hypothetical protein